MARLLGAFASVGMLRRMIQFKEKANKDGDASLALLDYPVLMAADILLYQPDLVPVGEDQTQHLQLTRELAERFNHRYGGGGTGMLKIPRAHVLPDTARIMSLTDGRRKMSKSEPNDNSRINLLDSPDVIRAKIRKAKTDAVRGLQFDNPERPEAHNLLALYVALTGKSAAEAASECADMQFGQFKALLADAAIAVLEPIQRRYHELMSDRAQLVAVLSAGAARASSTAQATVQRTAAAMGFLLAQ